MNVDGYYGVDFADPSSRFIRANGNQFLNGWRAFAGPPDKVQRIGYAVAADMYERLCGDDGYVQMPP